jgi:outer membrane protein assembly factor BamD
MSKLIFLLAGIVLIMTSSCKSEFERIRTSGEPELLYKKAFAYYDEGEYQKAQTLLELVISAYRGRQESEEIYFRYAYTYYHLGQYLLASYYFKNFSQTYSTSAYREEADFMDAYSNYQLSPSFRLDQTYTEKAIDGFQLFVNTYPDSERVQECNRLIDELRSKLERKAFEEANLYFNLRHYQSAIHIYENLLKDFPETSNAEEVRYLILRSNYLLAENSVIDKQKERFRETLTLAFEFLERYGEDSEYRKEVIDIKDNSEKKLNQIDNV